MNVAIIEFERNIPEALNYFPPDNSLYLSVSAEASYGLSQRNIPFVTDEDILSPQEFKQLGNDNFEIVETWTCRLDEILHLHQPVLKEKQFCPFSWHFYRLKILLDAVRIRRILIERLIEKENPALIGIPASTKPEMIRDHDLFFLRDDSLYGLLAQMIAAQKGIAVKTWNNAGSGSDRLSSFGKTKDFSFLFERILSKLSRIPGEVKAFINYRKTKDNILLGTVGYDIEPLRHVLSDTFNFYLYNDQKGISSVHACVPSFPKEYIADVPKIIVPECFNTITVTGDEVVDEILGKRVQSYAQKYIPILWIEYAYIEAMDRKKNFKAFISSAGATNSFYGMMIHYFSSKGKPVIVVQHGAYGFCLNRSIEYYEFGHDGYFLSWGDGIREMYETRKKGKCSIVSTGSHLIEDIRRKRKVRKKITNICYLPGSYRGYTAHYPNGQPCLDSKRFSLETAFLSTIKDYAGKYRITYKVQPGAYDHSPIFGKNPMIDWIKKNISGAHIEPRPLLSVIHDYDLFIIDFPTTVLVQALASGAEVLAYVGNPYHFPSEEDLELLRRRAVVGYDEDDFKGKIKKVLDKGIAVSNIYDTSFLEKYGLYLNDNKSLERMMNQVLGLCLDKKPCSASLK